jgi:hypothetical protein
MGTQAEAKIARLSESETVPFGPLAHYNRLIGDDGLPIFTGVQTCKPGYQTPLHWHLRWTPKTGQVAKRESRP